MSTKCPEGLTKYNVPSILKHEKARDFKSDITERLKEGQQMCLDLDEVSEIDLAGFNTLVVACNDAENGPGAIYLSMSDNQAVLEYFDYAGLTFLINNLHGGKTD